jgi:hypothetical protein
MSAPPQSGTCDPGEECTPTDPGWQVATLYPSDTGTGLADATCEQTAGNTCTFDGTGVAGATKLHVGNGRQIVIWCSTTGTQVRFSFTNADAEQAPIGMGWWDVDVAQTVPPGPSARVPIVRC